MSRKRILIMVDHKWRDLPGHALVAEALRRRHGHDVRLVRVGLQQMHVPLWRPHMVVVNSMYGRYRRNLTRRLAARNIHVAVLPTEGITYGEQLNEHFACKWCDTSDVGLYLLWNRRVADVVERERTMPMEKIRIVGCVRFDFYRDPLRRMLKPRDEFNRQHGLNPDWPTLVWATNYVQSTFLDKNTDFYIRDLKTLGVTNLAALQDLRAARFDREDKRRAQQVVAEFLRQARHLNLVIKIHPSEPVVDYEGFTRDFDQRDKNVRLIMGEYMPDVLNAADVFLARISTSTVEAWLFDLDTIELLTMEDYNEAPVQPIFSDGNYVVHDARALLETFEQIRAGRRRTQEMNVFREQTIEHLCHYVDGRSHVRIADAMHEFLQQNPNEPRVKWDVWHARWLAEALAKRTLRLPENLRAGEILRKYILRQGIDDFLGRFDKAVTDEAIAHWQRYWAESELLTVEDAAATPALAPAGVGEPS